ncbi:unnamed protein product [Effrenium voratum]|nr:unnamed protein product [Effrenium voratum]
MACAMAIPMNWAETQFVQMPVPLYPVVPMPMYWMNEVEQVFYCVPQMPQMPQECAAEPTAWEFDWSIPQEKGPEVKMPQKHKYLAMAMDEDECWELQALIRKATNQELAEMAWDFRGHVREAVESMHGNHVIQKFVDYMKPSESRFILEELEKWAPLARLAKHRYACRVLERILEQYPADAMKELLDTLVTNAKDLIFDSYGNYVLRVLLEHGPSSHKNAVTQLIMQNLGFLSKNIRGCALLYAAMTYGEHADKKQVAEGLILQGLVNSMRRQKGSRDVLDRIWAIAEELPHVQWPLQKQLSRRVAQQWRNWG